MSSEEQIEFTHPGPILRAARDELRLTVEQVAEKLHLRPSVVAMIESETYDDFSSDVFLKGYFRSYCRLVGLHEERMVDLLETQLGAIKEERVKFEKNEQDEKAREKRSHMFKLTLVAGSLVGICVVVLWSLVGGGNTSAPVQEKQSASQIVTSDSSVQSSRLVDTEEAGTSLAEQADASEFESSADIIVTNEKASAAELLASDTVIPSNGGVASQANDDPGLVAEREVQDTEQLSHSDTGVLNTDPADTVTIAIEFAGECWFEAYDREGNRIGADLKQAGSRFDYEGAKPVRIVLGDGNAASVLLDGLAYDFSSRIRRSGRAELVID